MILYSFAILILAACALAYKKWRYGVLAAIVVALIQDPVRKLVPGTPGLLSMSSLPVWFAVIAGAYRVRSIQVKALLTSFPKWGRTVTWFGVYLLIPAAISATYGRGTWMITILGATVFCSILWVIVCGWQFPITEQDSIRVLSAYALVGAVLLVGGPLEYLGWNQRFAIIGTEVLDHVWVTFRTGRPVYMIAGFFRSPDVMGWHAVMVFMVASILAIRSRGIWRYIWIAVAIWAATNVWLCGRRKMVSMVPVFFGAYLLLMAASQKVRRIVPAIAIMLIATGIGWQFISHYFYDDAVEHFYWTAFEEADDQLYRHVVGAVVGTIQQAGFFGYGLGMGQQGIHHIDADKPRLWQESGPSKLFAELGVPGAVLFVVMIVYLAMTLFYIVKGSRNQVVHIAAGIFAILFANAMTALVSAQIFGDAFVVLWLAMLVGLLLATHRLSLPPPVDGEVG